MAATLTCATTTTTTGRVIPSNNNTTELDLTNRCGKNSRKRSHRVIGFVRCLHQLQQMRSAAAKSGDGLLKFSRNSESDLAFTNAIHVTTPETVLGYNGKLLVYACLYSSFLDDSSERVKPCFSQVLVSVLTERKTVLARKIDHSRVMLCWLGGSSQPHKSARYALLAGTAAIRNLGAISGDKRDYGKGR